MQNALEIPQAMRESWGDLMVWDTRTQGPKAVSRDQVGKFFDDVGVDPALEGIDRELRSLEEEYAAKNQAIGELRGRIEQLSSSRALLALQGDLEMKRQQLRDSAMDWLRAQIALFVLDKAISKYETTRQPEVIKAAILCRQYNLNPLMRQVYLIEFGSQWVTVLGIKATRQIAQQALRRRGIRYSYADGPRRMTDEEQQTIRGRIDNDKLWSITVLKDSAGNLFPGYGFSPAA